MKDISIEAKRLVEKTKRTLGLRSNTMKVAIASCLNEISKTNEETTKIRGLCFKNVKEQASPLVPQVESSVFFK